MNQCSECGEKITTTHKRMGHASDCSHARAIEELMKELRVKSEFQRKYCSHSVLSFDRLLTSAKIRKKLYKAPYANRQSGHA